MKQPGFPMQSKGPRFFFFRGLVGAVNFSWYVDETSVGKVVSEVTSR